MKHLFTLLALFVITFSYAQDSTAVHATAPQIVSKLTKAQPITLEDTTFKFVKVISDSRCPKGVQCIRAGEAIVLVDVVKGGKTISQKRLTFTPMAMNAKDLTLLDEEGLLVRGVNLMPYPDASKKINPADYYLQLQISR